MNHDNNAQQKVNNVTNGKQQQQTEEKYKPARIYIQPTKFEKTHSVSILTTKDLSGMVNSIFMNAFADYFASRVSVRGADIDLEIEFSPLTNGEHPSAGQLVGLEDVATATGRDTSGVLQKIEMWNGHKLQSNRYRLTKEAKESLAFFIPSKYHIGNKNGTPKINWGQAGREDCEVTYYGQNTRITYKVPLDITTFINQYYGNKDENGDKCFYFIQVQRSLGLMYPEMYMQGKNFMCGNNYAFQITQILESGTSAVNASLNGGPSISNDGFVPAR